MKKRLIPAILLGMASTLSSCDFDLFNIEDNIELLYSIDISKSVGGNKFPTSGELYRNIISRIGMVDGYSEYYGRGVTVYFSYIGEDLQPVVIPVVLQRGSGEALDNRRIRENKVLDFQDQLRVNIQALLEKKGTHDYTYMASSLAYQAKIMRKNEFADTHEIIVVSDNLEDSRVDFRKIIASGAPDKWKAAADRILERHYPMGDLSGFRITLLPCPLPDRREASEIATPYWIERLEKAGAEINVVGNLF